jgi:hypothetical protein
MKPADVLRTKKGEILERCFERVAETYPEATSAFLMHEQDAFANPVGHSLRKGLAELLECLIEGADQETLEKSLEPVIRIRAVQEFCPSEALSFIGLLKETAWEGLESEGYDELSRDLADVGRRFDQAMLIAFDLYVDCRRRIDELRINEAKAEKERLLRLIKAMNRGSGRTEMGEAS